MDRVFRIRQWKSGGIIMPTRFSEFKKDNRLFFDNHKAYERKLATLKRQADALNKDYTRLVITGEEFLDSRWEMIYTYPKDFDLELLIGKGK